MSLLLEPVVLRGARTTLVPLRLEHATALSEAVADGELWRLPMTIVPTPAGMLAEIDRRLALHTGGSMLPFCVLDAAGTPVGMTNYMNVDTVHLRVEIGYTWLAKRVQRTGLNTEAKFLLLEHAFERLDCIAVEFRTHWLNQQSRRAIERLGAKLDGVLRCHMRMPDGSLRDSCVYSIVQHEWPGIRNHLQRLLQH